MRPIALVSLTGGKAYPLDKDFTLVGRQETCDLRIDHKSVSKQHCVLVKRGVKLWVRDLGSTNGSHVNGKRVRRAEINIKDVLGIAGFNFRLVYPDEGKFEVKGDAGTKKLNPEEIRRLENKEPSHPPENKNGLPDGPMVQVNTLPDEYTPVADSEE